jgi:hypothetical protein
MDWQIHETKESFIKKNNVTVPDATYWLHEVIAFHKNAARKVLRFVADQKRRLNSSIFIMPRNTIVKQKGSSAVLIRMLGLNVETFCSKFMNGLHISGPNLKVTSKTTPSKNSSHSFCTLLFHEKIGQKKCENYTSEYGNLSLCTDEFPSIGLNSTEDQRHMLFYILSIICFK